MTPTPLAPAAAPSMAGFWLIVGSTAVLLILLAIGVATGVVNLNPRRVRSSISRGVVTFDQMLASGERRAAIEYVLQEQDEVKEEQGRGEGSGDQNGDEDGAQDGAPDEADDAVD